LGLNHYENLGAEDQNLFFIGCMGGYFVFLGALERDFDDFGGINIFMGGLVGLYYYYEH
jgi:hypothetical protein